jgi:hypothetical protein
MPAISRFFGIPRSRCTSTTTGRHFHVRAAGHGAKVRIDTLEVLDSDLPRRELRLVLVWAEMRSAERV